jgi:AcrR family transcriptional regulator
VARAEAQERTKEALLEAAAEEFFAGGALATLEGLASKVKVTKQTLLRHFGSKEGLLQQALTRSAADVVEQRWSAPVGDVEGAVENLLEHYDEWGERGMRLEAWQISPTPFARLARMGRRIHSEWVEYAFAPWLDARDGRARARLTAQLVAICDVQVWWVLTHYLKMERDEVRATLVEMVEKIVGPKPSTAGRRSPPARRPSSRAAKKPVAKKPVAKKPVAKPAAKKPAAKKKPAAAKDPAAASEKPAVAKKKPGVAKKPPIAKQRPA